MASITLSVQDPFKEHLKKFIWINWSEVAREETLKKIIFERYIKTKELSDKEWAFCERIDWHPVDELPFKEEYLKKIEKIKKGKFIRLNSVDEIFKNHK